MGEASRLNMAPLSPLASPNQLPVTESQASLERKPSLAAEAWLHLDEEAMLAMPPKAEGESSKSPKLSDHRRQRRRSVVEDNMENVIDTCSEINKGYVMQRRKSMELQEEAAATAKRLDSLLQLGKAVNVVKVATRLKTLVKKNRESDDYVPTFDYSGKNYDGNVVCFVCDTDLSKEDVNMSLCPLCSCVLNHKTIKPKKVTR